MIKIEKIRQAYSAADEQLRKKASNIQASCRRQVACGTTEGCCHCCCSMEILPNEGEVQSIVEYLEQPQNVAKKAAMMKRLPAQKTRNRHQSNVSVACVFLEDGKCSIYDVRPFVCRIFCSDSPQSCADYEKLGKDAVTVPQGWILDPLKKVAVSHIRTLIRAGEPTYEINQVFEHLYHVSEMSSAQRLAWATSTSPEEFPFIHSRYP